MVSKDKIGIYQIRCRNNGKLYVGSSTQIYVRWSQHRKSLKSGKHSSPYLQNAWSKYGGDAFEFSILEECDRAELMAREQHYIDALGPAFNSVTNVATRCGPVPRAKIAAATRARAAKITHCPRGHEYTPENTYRNAKGKRICRACNALRVATIYASETPDQRGKRMKYKKAAYEANKAELLAAMAKRAALHKAEKKEYDRLRRERLKQDGVDLIGS